ncbi:hypothetical protein ILUMI_16082 [Ignelater luminosus]|uniref:HTH CENPB-type domain-containing protein n=1 Tax=Ignelater luminosus TaxID=2038154 RepID=A0A8K0CQZ9_IGNLU|nr:hypothetical protein ILUMI_16082 [Ignelater luminosus]
MWFCQERRKGTPISEPIIKEKAVALHKKVEAGSEFAASEGWIDRWKTRHGVRFVSISGEKLSADAEAAKEFSVKFQEIVEENELLTCQVYNIDETGLNYKMLPNKTLAASNETVAGTKLIKDRLTIAPCSNGDVKGDIKAIFLPPNVTSLIQPMDQEVIEWLKRRYRRKYISSILEKSEEGCNILEAMKSLNIKDAIYTIAESWEELKPDTLRKSWRKLWPEVMTESDQIEDEQNYDTQEIVKDLQTVQVNVPANEVEEWIAQCDEDCETSEELNDDEIIAAVLENNSEETERGLGR